MPQKGTEQRKTRRVSMKLSARVQGRDPNGTKWEEMTVCEDASAGGVSLVLRKAVQVGQVLHMTLPLPPRFRQYDLTQASYRVYGLVRSRRSGNRYGVLFLGRHPPRGAEALPAGLFLMPGDPRPAAAGKHGFEVNLRLEAENAPGGVAHEERAVASNVKERQIQVKVAALPVFKGAVVTLEEVNGDYATRAEVQGIEIAGDGHPRLTLFLDEPVPERLMPPVGHDKTSS
jgi:hypothetical protein